MLRSYRFAYSLVSTVARQSHALRYRRVADYHYLVSEFFMVAPMNITKEAFFKLSKRKQADLIWDELFVKRLPISEAQLGVLTTLQMLGLEDYMEKKDLDGIRAWYAKQDIARYAQRVFKIAGVKYAVMTNVPFDENEAQYFRTRVSNSADYPIPPFLKQHYELILYSKVTGAPYANASL